MHISYKDWEPVIGLEIHVQLNTQSKLFSSAPNQFGSEPNTNISFVDTGQPGALPILNKEAVKKAVLFGLAIGSDISTFSKFDRKSYFYPDSPRNYQITQFDYPILKGGTINIQRGQKEVAIAIDRAHLEDDAGMLKHFSTFAGIDFNRAGVPLLEIVSKPCMHSPQEAILFATEIKSIMEYIGASDCNMEEGSLRVDINISVRKRGESTLRNKVEIKNLNSFNTMEQAIESEIRRQVAAYSLSPHKNPKEVVRSATVRFDMGKKTTVVMRMKEHAADYRYFPEPDLPPIILTETYIQELRNSLPELPAERRNRYINEFHLSEPQASTLVINKELSDFFEEGLKFLPNPIALCNWITVEFVGRVKDSEKTLPHYGISIQHITQLIQLIESKTITGKIAKNIADIMVLYPQKSPKEIIHENPDFVPIHDTGVLESIIDQVIKENPQSCVDYRNGKEKAYHFLVGQIMKTSRGKADPNLVQNILLKKIQ